MISTKQRPSRVNLAWELMTIRDGVEGARLIMDTLKQKGFALDAEVAIAPEVASAILTLCSCRMRAVVSAMRGTLDPAYLLDRSNATDGPAEPEEGGVTLEIRAASPSVRSRCQGLRQRGR